jgi:hypothetical protein
LSILFYLFLTSASGAGRAGEEKGEGQERGGVPPLPNPLAMLLSGVGAAAGQAAGGGAAGVRGMGASDGAAEAGSLVQRVWPEGKLELKARMLTQCWLT